METPLIRLAGADDLPAVRALLIDTWHDTYDLLLGADRVTEITDSWHSVETLRGQLTLPKTAFLIAENKAGRIVGHALADARRAPDLVISRLYVLPPCQRQGIGAKLLAAALASFPRTAKISLDVEADNLKGLAFYERESFQPLSEHIVEGLRHIRMVKQLDRRL